MNQSSGTIGQSLDRDEVLDLRPITPMQQGMIYHAITTPGRGVDIEQITFELDHALDVDRFTDAWNLVLANRDILRSSFNWVGVPEPVRVVHAEVDMPVTVHEWADAGPLEVQTRIEGLLQSDRASDFDLSSPPLQRLHLARTGVDTWWGLWSFHHTLLDGRSFPLVLADVFTAYDTGEPPTGNDRFDAFAEALTAIDHTEALATWSERLDGFEPAQPLRVHVDTVHPTEPWHGVAARTLDRSSSDSIRRSARSVDVSVNNVIQTAWALLLHRYRAGEYDEETASGASNDIVFGTTRACRHLTPEASDAIGLLINTVPLRLQLDRATTAAELARQARDHQRSLRPIEATPLHLIQQAAEVAPGSDLFDSLVVYDDASLDSRMRRAGFGEGRRFGYEGQTNIAITIVAYGDDEISLRLEYANERLSPNAAQRMIDQMVVILDAIGDDPDRPIGEIPYLTEVDRALLSGWNDTAVDQGAPTTLVELFEAQVDRTPEAIALRFGDTTVSYDELNRRANSLAELLIDRGVGPEGRVGVLAHRCVEMMVAIYGIAKAGGAYVPLDPGYPIERLNHIVADAELSLALCAGDTSTGPSAIALSGLGVDIVDVETLERSDGWSTTTPNPLLRSQPSDAAYVIFTSGSTGRPKGVVNEHGGIVNRLRWMQRAFQLDEDDVVLQKTPFTFDVSVWELFWPLQIGAELVIARPGAHTSTADLTSEIIRTGVTTLHFVPSMLVPFTDDPDLDRCTTMRRVICSGEALPRDLHDRFLDRTAGAAQRVELHNLYGPTEAAVDVTWWSCNPASDLPIVPIGSAIDNTTMHVLDHDLEPVPPGGVGELFIGGVQVARGYLRRPELTAERFLADPRLPGGRLYRTGDLGRHRPDGSLEYLGRTDHQVKIRGHRIELGEIEAVLSQHAAIEHCVVIDREDRPGDRRLVAYVVRSSAAGATTLPADLEHSVRTHLARSLSDYMIPANIVVLASLPLSSNGKIDRARLPAPQLAEVTDDAQPIDATERAVADIWAELLDIDASRLGRTTPFFQAGGHSLLAIKLAARLSSSFDRDVTVTELLDRATIEAQAALIVAPVDSESEAELRAVAERASRRRASTRPGNRKRVVRPDVRNQRNAR